MKTYIFRIKKIRIHVIFLSIFLYSVSAYSQALNLNVSDNTQLNIASNTYLKVAGNLNLGEGSSGKIITQASSVNIIGNINADAGSELNILNNTVFAADFALNVNNTCRYSGNNQNIYNWHYGHLILNGTGQMQITGDAGNPTTAENLTINNTGNSLIVGENKALTVSGTTTNNAGISGIVIKSSASGTGSVIAYTAGISAQVERFVSGNQWHYMASPIDNLPRTQINSNNFIWWDASMQWNGLGDYSPWKTFSATNLYNAQGYAFFDNETTLSFSGNLNAGDYSRTLYKSAAGNSDEQGWNLVGNPFSSALDWDLAVADGAVPSGAENAIYFFDDADGSGEQSNYHYYVPSSGGTYGIGTEDADKDIPLGQAFFIKTNTDNVTLNLKAAYREHNAQAYYKNTESEIMRISLSNNNLSDETVLRFVPGSTLDFDAAYDARKLFAGSEEIPQIYSFSWENNTPTAINSITKPESETHVPIGFHAIAGNYTCNVLLQNIDLDYIWLTDRYLNTKIDLKKQSTYTFEHAGGNCNNRFSIVFNQKTTDIQSDAAQNIAVYPNPASDFLNINMSQNSEYSIELTDICGKSLYKAENQKGLLQIDINGFDNGIYFLSCIDNDNNTFSKKIVIQK